MIIKRVYSYSAPDVRTGFEGLHNHFMNYFCNLIGVVYLATNNQVALLSMPLSFFMITLDTVPSVYIFHHLRIHCRHQNKQILICSSLRLVFHPLVPSCARLPWFTSVLSYDLCASRKFCGFRFLRNQNAYSTNFNCRVVVEVRHHTCRFNMRPTMERNF